MKPTREMLSLSVLFDVGEKNPTGVIFVWIEFTLNGAADWNVGNKQ